jgi:hypothetical protein
MVFHRSIEIDVTCELSRPRSRSGFCAPPRFHTTKTKVDSRTVLPAECSKVKQSHTHTLTMIVKTLQHSSGPKPFSGRTHRESCHE